MPGTPKTASDATADALERFASGEASAEATLRSIDRIGEREDRQLENLQPRQPSPIGSRARRGFTIRR